MTALTREQRSNMPVKQIHRLPEASRGMAVRHGEIRYIDPDWQQVLNEHGLSENNSWLDQAPGLAVSESKNTNCFKVQTSDGRSFFFKRYTYIDSNQSRYWLRASKAQVEVFGYAQLKRIGIPTLNVIGFGEKRKFGKLIAAYIITEGIDNSMDLQQFAAEVWFDMPVRQRTEVYQSLRAQIFDQLQRCHRHKFFHQDLHWRNILITQAQGHYKATWIDCPRAAYRKFYLNARHGQMVDLSCLARRGRDYLSRSERYRAISDYLQLNNQGWSERRLFAQIDAHHKRSANPPVPMGIAGHRKQFRP